jgi:hypothetical protein
VLPSCFVPVVVAVTIIVEFVVTSFHLCQFCGALSCSSDAPILCHLCGDAQLSTLLYVRVWGFPRIWIA